MEPQKSSQIQNFGSRKSIKDFLGNKKGLLASIILGAASLLNSGCDSGYYGGIHYSRGYPGIYYREYWPFWDYYPYRLYPRYYYHEHKYYIDPPSKTKKTKPAPRIEKPKIPPKRRLTVPKTREIPRMPRIRKYIPQLPSTEMYRNRIEKRLEHYRGRIREHRQGVQERSRHFKEKSLRHFRKK